MNELAPLEINLWIRPKALLEGNELVRLTYLDEAGISRNEPFAVVAGVIVHGDQQLASLEEYLQRVVEEFIPPRDQIGFVFQAKHLFGGVKYFRDRDKWPEAKRFEILKILAATPKAIRLPIVHGVSKKDYVRTILPNESEKILDFVFHASAFANAAQLVEAFFREIIPNEHTLLICEDRPEVRKRIKRVHLLLQGRGKERMPDALIAEFSEIPYRHIKDAVHFAEKSESPPLQIADVCSFLIRGFLTRHPKSLPLFEEIAPNLLDRGQLPSFGISS